jgi:undecaprenyl-diphosphatase
MKKHKLLFWQPRYDYLKYLTKTQWGRILIIILNYSIWLFLFYISYLLIRFQTNIFWQLLLATIIGEIIEKYGKSHLLWRRPLFERHDATPPGLVDRWYQTGSFPSGHTIKAVFFFLFLLQYPVFPITNYLLLTILLLFFRVLIGFHYPIDMLGGMLFGTIIWFFSKWLVAPIFLTDIIRSVFNFIFFIN